jgi:hypothetical protein
MVIMIEGERMKFQDIRQFTAAHYVIDLSWDYLEEWLKSHEDLNLELEPDFQRAHVWDNEKRSKYIEFQLQGGKSGKDIYWNCKGWMNKSEGPLMLVDGLQRITAVRKFLNNDNVTAFGHYFKEFEGHIPNWTGGFKFHINNLSDRKDILTWYIDLNDGGVVHTTEEIDKVKKMLEEETK